MKYLVILMLFVSSLTSCAIPIKVTTYKDPVEISKEEKAEKKLLQKEKYDKIYSKAMKRLARKTAEKKKLQELAMQEKTNIVKKKIIINAKDTIIQAIMAESGLPEPRATIFWDKYKLSKEKSFIDFIIKLNPDGLHDKYYTNFMERVKVRIKMIKKENLKKNESEIRFFGKTLGILIEDEKKK